MAKQKPGQEFAIDHALIRELAGLLDETGLTEIEIERSGQRVRVARGGAVTHVTKRSLVRFRIDMYDESGAAVVESS